MDSNGSVSPLGRNWILTFVSYEGLRKYFSLKTQVCGEENPQALVLFLHLADEAYSETVV